MRNMTRRVAAALLCGGILLFPSVLPTAYAVPVQGDEAYTEIAKTPGSNSCANTQGFAASEEYLYSVQINSSNTRAFMNRIDKKTGKMTPMRNAETRGTVFNGLSHANSMDLVKLDGVEYLLVMSSTKILAFKIDGKNLVAHGAYEVKWGEDAISPYAFTVYRTEGEKISFVFLLNNTLATGSASLAETEGDIDLAIQGYIDVAAVPVDGKDVDCTQYLKQGICCDGDILYVIVTGNHVDATINHSLLLAYDLTKASLSYEKPIPVDTERTRCIVSEEYPGLFEMEDIDIDPEGKMYFNTNSWKIKYGQDFDAVCVLNDFAAEGESAQVWNNPFTDVKKTDWFFSDVAYMNTHGMMNGISDTTFGPAEPLLRGQIVTVLWRLDGQPAPKNKNTFTDVKADWYYTDAIAWAAENKIVEGHGNGKFAPDDPVTREQVMAILHRYYSYTGHIQVPAPAKVQHTCSEWAEKYVLWAEVGGILSDIGTDITDMTKPADRAEIAAYLRRFDTHLAGK